MGMVLSEGEIGSFQECVRRDLLTYVSYPSFKGATRCFAYPQFLVEDEMLTLLEDSAFPDNGCLPMVTSRTTPHELLDMFGNVVVMRVNDEHPGRNRNYPESEASRFNSIIDPYFAKGASSVEFMPLSRHSLSGSLVQVLDIQEIVDLTHAQAQPVHVRSVASLPQTKLVVVSQGKLGARKYYGPFEATCVEGAAVQLQASNSYDLRIGVFDESEFDFSIDLVDDLGNMVAQYISAEELDAHVAASDNIFDWITDKDLLDALGRISRSGETPLTKGQMRALKSEIASCLDEDAKIALTPERRERMLGLLGTYESWSTLPESVRDSAIENADPQQLAEYVLSNEHFRSFYDKVLESDQVRQRVEKEKAQYAAEAVEAQAAAKQAQESLSHVQDELKRFDDELDLRRKRFEEEMSSHVKIAQEERDKLVEEVHALKEQKDSLERGKESVRRQIDELVSSFSDEEVLMGRVLENAALKQVVSTVGGMSGSEHVGDGGECLYAAPCVEPLLSEEDGSDAGALLSKLDDLIGASYGRDIAKNDLANVLICLTQGYITTLAGLPGTGKTSLVNILAEVLGLKNVASKRFVEVPVEKGWTSYKDFIGYYNPFSKSLEKSNPVAFDALSLLDSECEQGVADSDAAPYLFLLDEANLSSIEHYWSPFLRACDSFRGGSFELSLGGNHSFKVPSYLRFIATVNFDHTTEELSPRFLDRSWVVTLDPQALDLDDLGDPLAPFNYKDASVYSYQALQAAFGPRSNALLSVELEAKLKEVVELCARHRYPVSPRSQKMMLSYACTAASVMDCSSAQTQYAPVDYAIAQKALPVLSGTEERLGALLEELSLVSNLPLTKARVDHMLEAGEDSGYYQYFA